MLDRLLTPGTPTLTPETLADRAGVDREFSNRLWRAIGFPDLPENVPVFTEEGLDALRNITGGLNSLLPTDEDPEEALVRQVRAICAGLSRIAEVLSDGIAASITTARQVGMSEQEIASLLVDGLDWERISNLTDYALRLQVRAAVRRKCSVENEPTSDLSVGFLDLVGYTAISQELDSVDLDNLIVRFDALTRDSVAELGGRVVKTIGDEVMYVADDPHVAVEIALRLTERTAGDDQLPEARAGVDLGAAVTRDGDYYGPAVNLAHRLVEVARPGTVLVSGSVHHAVIDNPEFAWSRMRVRRIRDIGRIETFSVRSGDRSTTVHQ